MNIHILMKKLHLSNKSRIYIFIFAIIMRTFLTFLEHYYGYYLRGTHSKSISYLIIIFLAITIIKPVNKMVKYIFYIFIGFLCLCISLIMLFDSSTNQFYYYSPNKETQMIINENSFLFASLIDVYEEKYYIFKRKIYNVDISPDDGYRPFLDNSVSLNWINEREVIIRYRFRSNDDIWRSDHIKFD